MTPTPEVLKTFEIIALLAGVGYAVLAARRNRLCWLAGAVGSALAAVVYGAQDLPMQAGLQVFFVGMSVYGWMSWTSAAAAGEFHIGLWPLPWHIGAAVVFTLLSVLIARLLAGNTQAAWPLLDSLTTCFSLLATWLAARGKLENWLYWMVIDTVLVFLSYKQELLGMALLNLLYIGIAAGGFIAWRRRLPLPAVPAC